MESLSIKPYSPAWQQQVIDLILPIQQIEFSVPITLKEQPDLENIPSFYQENKGNFWLAIDDEKVVGCIALLNIGHGVGALRKMFVRKEYRGQEYGVGQALLSHLLYWARKHFYKEILLGTTDQFVAAQRFYEKNGFVEIEKEALPKAFPVMEVDTKFYKYML